MRKGFISFLFALARGDGRRASELLLSWSAHQVKPQPPADGQWGTDSIQSCRACLQECPDTSAFRKDVEAMFAREADIRSPQGIDVDRVLKATLQLCRRHQVSVDSGYASLVLGVAVICGFATSLDPGLNLIDASVACFMAYNLTGKVMGRLYG